MPDTVHLQEGSALPHWVINRRTSQRLRGHPPSESGKSLNRSFFNRCAVYAIWYPRLVRGHLLLANMPWEHAMRVRVSSLPP